LNAKPQQVIESFNRLVKCPLVNMPKITHPRSGLKRGLLHIQMLKSFPNGGQVLTYFLTIS